jgi:hypothetical protein
VVHTLRKELIRINFCCFVIIVSILCEGYFVVSESDSQPVYIKGTSCTNTNELLLLPLLLFTMVNNFINLLLGILIVIAALILF